MKYAVVTFGCRVNQADTLGIEQQLHTVGGYAVPLEDADLVVVNTCSVTATADQGARQVIRRIARINPAARIVATGCYATRAATDLTALPGVVGVLPNDDKDRFIERLSDSLDRSTASPAAMARVVTLRHQGWPAGLATPSACRLGATRHVLIASFHRLAAVGAA